MTRWFWVAGLVLAGCGGSGQAEKTTTPQAQAPPPPPPSPVHEKGNEKLIVEVGPAGGTLELINGARLEIPSGALPEPVQMTLAEAQPTTAFANKEYEKPIGPIVDVTPALVPAQPLVLSVPAGRLPEGFEPEDVTLAAEVKAEQQRGFDTDHAVMTRWDYWPASTEGGRAVAQLEQLPGMRMQFVVSRSD